MIRQLVFKINSINSIRKISTTQSCRMPKIYTKTGDKGVSSTFTGERKSKDDVVFEALGATDELNCTIGLAREYAYESGLNCVENLNKIQCILQDAASSLATQKDSATASQTAKTQFSGEFTIELEKWIDELTKQLPPLKNFILPGGGKTSAILHLARSQCRTAERRVVSLKKEREIDDEVLKFLNRLSDYLFTVARHACHSEGKEELIYRRPHSTTDK